MPGDSEKKEEKTLIKVRRLPRALRPVFVNGRWAMAPPSRGEPIGRYFVYIAMAVRRISIS